MGQEKLLGYGVTALCLFLPWLFPSVPKIISLPGAVFAVIIILAALFTKTVTGPILLGGCGIIMTTAAAVWGYTSYSLPSSLTKSSQTVSIPPQTLSVSSQVKARAAGIDLNLYSKKTCFDYSTNNGIISVSLNDIKFDLHFSNASDSAIYLYKDSTNITALARVKGIFPGDDLDFRSYDNTSRVYTIGLGEYFILKNDESYFLLGRILSIKDDTRGDPNDEVCFTYSIDTSKSGKFKAM